MNTISLAKSIDLFLDEDINTGDITSSAIFDENQSGTAIFVAKQATIAAGLGSVAFEVFKRKNNSISLLEVFDDGRHVAVGDVLLKVHGPVVDLLVAERVALNLAQRLCGIAYLTSCFVEKVEPYKAYITDTRKTTPGLRMLEKYAVRAGGGKNHRFSLADGVLIKDNHIAACGSITAAVDKIRRTVPHTLKIEVETSNLEEVGECLACNVEIIMLDNMSPKMMEEAVQLVNGKALLEASGGVTLGRVEEIAKTGVDIISIGALTHSAPASDISMRLEVEED